MSGLTIPSRGQPACFARLQLPLMPNVTTSEGVPRAADIVEQAISTVLPLP
jgi:hypothetical protein